METKVVPKKSIFLFFFLFENTIRKIYQHIFLIKLKSLLQLIIFILDIFIVNQCSLISDFDSILLIHVCTSTRNMKCRKIMVQLLLQTKLIKVMLIHRLIQVEKN